MVVVVVVMVSHGQQGHDKLSRKQMPDRYYPRSLNGVNPVSCEVVHVKHRTGVHALAVCLWTKDRERAMP